MIEKFEYVYLARKLDKGRTPNDVKLRIDDLHRQSEALLTMLGKTLPDRKYGPEELSEADEEGCTQRVRAAER
ncbi:hypothetical protein LTR62_007438 [Meristemomyces frigidus]|uniref:Uncharacterized protein n=1 Tax=Meristemomyces frigidus TaxID=1508187 RepID=A0AAN7YT84_9PEZI|nr:hypothetical protein LTR62_007438 [Meristemomyces frigidus]